MLDKFTQRLMDSLHRSVKKTVIPMREVLRQNVNAQMDIGSKLLKFGTMILLFLGITKMNQLEDRPKKLEQPTIIINNYLNDKHKKEEDA